MLLGCNSGVSVGMWWVNGNPNPCTNLDEILHAHSHLPRKVVLTLAPSSLALGV